MMSQAPQTQRLHGTDIARLLSGSLEGAERKLLLARLAADEDARELLRMAMEALEAAEKGQKGLRAA